MSNVAKNFDILATTLSVLYSYFDSSRKLLFLWSTKLGRAFEYRKIRSKKNGIGIKPDRTPGKHADLPSRGIGGNKHAAYLPETKGHR